MAHKFTDAQIETAKAAVRLSDWIGAKVRLVKKGREHVGLCPFHNEKTPSFCVMDDKQFFFCHGCGASGDIFDWLRESDGLDWGAAMERISGEAPKTRAAAPKAVAPEPSPIVWPVPAEVDRPDFRLGGQDASRVWEYRTADGSTLFYVARYERDGRKEIRPWIWTRDGWIMRHAPAPRPLYGLEKLAERPEHPVIVTEGEKACDALRRLLPGYVVVTWPGGTNAIKHVKWDALANRDVTVMPDDDAFGVEITDEESRRKAEVGRKAALEVCAALAEVGAKRVRWLDYARLTDA